MWSEIQRMFKSFDLRLVLSLGIFFALGNVRICNAYMYQERIAYSQSLSHYAMGQVYDLLGMTNRAVLEYEQALSSDKDSYLIHLRLGTDYARLNMIDEAMKELNFVQKLNPKDLQSHYLLALIYSTERDYAKAIDEYEYILKSFVQSEPQNAEIYGYLAQLYYAQGKYDQAIEQFEQILTLEPDNIQVMELLAQLYYVQKKFSPAIQQFENILNLEPSNPDIMYLLGTLYLEVKESKKAMELLKGAIGLDPQHDGSLNTLGYLYAEEGLNLDEAQNLVERALQINPDNGAYMDSLGWVYYKKGMYDKALEVLTQAGKTMEDPVIYDHIADVYFKLNNIDEAIKYWELSLQLLPAQEEIIRKLNDARNNQVRMQVK